MKMQVNVLNFSVVLKDEAWCEYADVRHDAWCEYVVVRDDKNFLTKLAGKGEEGC